MDIYLVYLKADYVRDAQGYLFGKVEEISEKEEEGWGDVSGPLLLMKFQADSNAEAWDRIIRWYPEADPEVFQVEKICGTKVCGMIKKPEINMVQAVKEAENGWINTERRPC